MLCYGELELRARAIAAVLAGSVPPGSRALLLYPAGLDFVASFFGCTLAGVTAVPIPPIDSARPGRVLTRLQAVAHDARPAVALTTSEGLTAGLDLARQAPELAALPWIATDAVDPAAAGAWRPRRDPSTDDLAYLQYTSGSTSTPKGVMVSHRNLLANSESIQRAWGYGPGSTALMWVPNFHDDGLVHGILQPLFSGFPSYLMAPRTIVERPRAWLEAIGRVRATHSGGPNFAYALCVHRIPPPQRDGLDLASWRVAYNAAEPIQSATLEAFVRAFGPSGFRRETFFPSYGLAEATLLVSTRSWQAPGALVLRRDVLEREGRVEPLAGPTPEGKTLVDCGTVVPGTDLVIADPATGAPCAPGEMGEVWLSGPGIAQGYWNRPDATRETFGARLSTGAGPYLRTGDLGFVHEGGLYIAGRLKDVIIIRGRNHYPQDIELTVERSSPLLRPGCSAAFPVEIDGEERLVVVAEVGDGDDLDVESLAEVACRDVANAHEVQVQAFVLIPPRSIPKTSSGKIQRGACRAELLAGRLDEVGSWVLGRPAAGRHESAAAALGRLRGAARADRAPAARPETDERAVRAEEAVVWLRDWARERLDSRLIDERRSIPGAVILDLGDRGVFGLRMERALGGLDLSCGGAARVLEQLGALDLTLACLVTGHNSLGLHPLVRHAAAPLRGALLPDLVRGRAFASFALTEPGAGSNPRGMASVATPVTGGWRLRGTKVWIGSAPWARVIHTFAQVPAAPGQPGGITGFAVRQGAPGLRIGPEALTMGLRGMAQTSVHLEDVVVGEEDLLGAVGEGMEVAEETIALSRFFLGAVAVGGMRRCAQLLSRFASRRTVATGRLLDHPVVLSRLGEIAAATAAVDTLVGIVARRMDRGEPLPREVLAGLKTAAAEHLWQAVDQTVQLLGGRGYIETNGVPQILRDARIFRIFEGPSEALYQFVGSSELHGGALQGFLRGLPGGARTAERLLAAVEEVRERVPSRLRSADRVTALRWVNHLAGELAVSALLLGALEASATASERALEWARARFEEQVRRARDGGAGEAAALSPAEAERLAADLALAIGEVEPGGAGEDHAADPLLRLDGSPPPAVNLTAIPVADDGGMVIASAAPAAAQESIAGWVKQWIAEQVGFEEAAIDAAKPFSSLGLDSVTGVQLAADLGAWLGRPLDATLAWDFPTIDKVAAHVARGEAVLGSAQTDLDEETLALLRSIETLSPEDVQRALELELRAFRGEHDG